MAQYLKDDVQRRIAAAALEEFCARGFRSATMAAIARAAGISTGNIYRYYENKEVLFDDVVPPSLVRELKRLIRDRMKALEGVDDVRELSADAPWHVLSREVMDLALTHRLPVAILLSNAPGTRHEGFAEELIGSMSELALAHFHGLKPDLRVSATIRLNLAIVYRNLVLAMVRILTTFEEPTLIEGAVSEYTRFHLAGLKALFA